MALVVKNPPANADVTDACLILGLEDPLEEKMQPTRVVLPGESHGQRSLAAYNPWSHKCQTQLSMHAQISKTILTDSNNKYSERKEMKEHNFTSV